MADKQKAAAGSVFSYKGIPPAGQLIPLGLQHVVAAVVGVITPAIIISGVCGLDTADKTLLIQVSLILTALATLLQLFPIFQRIGAGLPVIMGISFAYVPTLQAIGADFGLGAILGAQIIGGIIAIVFGIFVKQIRVFFPPLVTGTVIFTIGLSLYPTAVKYMAGGASNSYELIVEKKGLTEALVYGSWQNWLVAFITLAAVFILANYTKGVFKLGSILFGMIVGYLAALCMGMVDFSGVGPAGWVQIPMPGHFKIEFIPAACVSLGIVYIVNAVQTIGDLSSTTMGGMERMPTDKELSGGIVAQGVMSIFGAFFGGLPSATYSQNVGIVTVNKVINRAVFTLAALVLLVAGFIPKFSAILTTIPQAVIGGATISVFATITMTGIRMITSTRFTMRSSTVVGLAVALGVGVTMSGVGCLAGFPTWVAQVFGSSSVVISTIVAILLNLILPKDPPEAKVVAKVIEASNDSMSAAAGVPEEEYKN